MADPFFLFLDPFFYAAFFYAAFFYAGFEKRDFLLTRINEIYPGKIGGESGHQSKVPSND
jgi:hypothetical protein